MITFQYQPLYMSIDIYDGCVRKLELTRGFNKNHIEYWFFGVVRTNKEHGRVCRTFNTQPPYDKFKEWTKTKVK